MLDLLPKNTSYETSMTSSPVTLPPQVQNALNLVLQIIPGQEQALGAFLASNQAAINAALTKVGTVHFARFLPVAQNTIMVVTTYDGDFKTYIVEFTQILGAIFDGIFKYVRPAPPLPVKDNVDAFVAFVDQYNIKTNLYSAYPYCTVQTILGLDCQPE